MAAMSEDADGYRGDLVEFEVELKAREADGDESAWS
jgi:hypothetical protein